MTQNYTPYSSMHINAKTASEKQILRILSWFCSLLIVLSFWATNTSAQVSTYTFAQSSNTYTSVTTTVLQATGWDDNVGTVTIPFTFTYNGIGYTTIGYNSNGYITFGATASSGTNYTPLSATDGYAGATAAFARDMVSTGAAGSTITGGVTGTTPNRVVVI